MTGMSGCSMGGSMNNTSTIQTAEQPNKNIAANNGKTAEANTAAITAKSRPQYIGPNGVDITA